MNLVAILGAGDLGATVARRLAEREIARRVVLVDADEGRAKGKALDLLQAGPVEGFDALIEGAAAAPPGADALVLADAADLEGREAPSRAVEAVKAAGPSRVVCASSRPALLLDALAAGGAARDGLLGSAPLAVAAAIRARVASEARVGAEDVALTVMGAPPDTIVVPQGGAVIGGLPAEAVAPGALRRAAAALTGRTPGPVALAAAAVEVLALLDSGTDAVRPAYAVARGEYGARGFAFAGPVRLTAGRVAGLVEVALAPVDRVALENAVEARAGAALREGRRSSR